MADTHIPGITAQHAVITPNCRRVQGGDGPAFEVAVNRLFEEYKTILELRSDRDQVDFHLVLTVEKKRSRNANPAREGVRT